MVTYFESYGHKITVLFKNSLRYFIIIYIVTPKLADKTKSKHGHSHSCVRLAHSVLSVNLDCVFGQMKPIKYSTMKVCRDGQLPTIGQISSVDIPQNQTTNVPIPPTHM